ncbi:hypothetical protein HHI36_009080 [Cryptolaemus montrouzieri]|uniref:Uncharacterized protein n=1 Tax=Cryptolaemus montrouzieri TaxID=559131 RepID=A0ABD2MUE8_9CUCU
MLLLLLKRNRASEKFTDLLQSFNLHKTIHESTRVTPTSKTLNIFVSDEENNIVGRVMISALSDHHAQIKEIPLNEEVPVRYNYNRIFSEGKLDEFAEAMDGKVWGRRALSCEDAEIGIFICNERKVHQIIKSLRNTNAVGRDEIPIKLLKCIAHIIVAPIIHLINLTLSTGNFPSKLKIARIKPVFKKKGDPTAYFQI